LECTVLKWSLILGGGSESNWPGPSFQSGDTWSIRKHL
jgi:hypothetical protein